jgi:hypothetical protein
MNPDKLMVHYGKSYGKLLHKIGNARCINQRLHR